MIKSFKKAIHITSSAFGIVTFFMLILASIFPKLMDLGNPEHTLWIAITFVILVIVYTIKFYKESKNQSK